MNITFNQPAYNIKRNSVKKQNNVSAISFKGNDQAETIPVDKKFLKKALSALMDSYNNKFKAFKNNVSTPEPYLHPLEIDNVKEYKKLSVLDTDYKELFEYQK